MTKRGDIKQWRELGDLIKQAHQNLLQISILASTIMPKRDCEKVREAERCLLSFRGHAEEIMFKQIGERGGATFNVFFEQIR
jgi:hypothetical protein